MIYFIYLLILMIFIELFSYWTIVSQFAFDLGASSLAISLMIGMSIFMKMVGSSLSGFLIDKIDVKIVGSIGFLITGLMLICYSWVGTPSQLLLIGLFHGLIAGLLIPILFSFLSKMTLTIDSIKRMAFSGISIGLAILIGPAYSEIINKHYGAEAVFSSIGFLFIWLAILIFVLFPDRLKKNKEKRQRSELVKVMRGLLKQPRLGYGYAGALLLMFALGTATYLLPIRVDQIGYDSSLINILIVMFAFISILIFALPTDVLYRRFPIQQTMAVGITLFAMSFFIMGIFKIKMLLFIVAFFMSVGFSSVYPNTLALIVEGSSEEERGKAYGLLFSFSAFGFITGMVISAVMAQISLSFLIAAIFLLLSTIFLWLPEDLMEK